MAKKLNTKVAIIGIIIVMLVMGSILGVLIGPKVAHKLGIGRNPDKALAKAKELEAAGDYEDAEKEYGRAYAFGKTDAYKIERLFDLAQFHLIDNNLHVANWKGAINCWNTILKKIDPQNQQALQQLLDYYYQVADAGDSRVWKIVNEYTTKLIEIFEAQSIEPEPDLLTKHAKSLFFMAQRGESTDRREQLNQSKELLDQLIQSNPEKDELYLLRAQCELLQGQIDQLTGIRNAEERSRQNALEYLETGTQNAEDKAAATANLLTFKIQNTVADPNEINKLMFEIASLSEKFPPNPKLLRVTSIAYENAGNMSLEAGLNRAIEAMRQACQLDPDNMEYTIRMFSLLYRKGTVLKDPDAIADAIDLAENTLTRKDLESSGPLQNRNLQYRLFIHSFLAEIYFEKSYQENQENNKESADQWVQKARPHIENIKNEIGTDENSTVQKFEGMLALAEGRESQAIRLMYKAYEQGKALDQQGQPSEIDPVLCITLARMMKQKGQLGMEREFLEKAINNRKRQWLQNPDILLDYAQVLASLRGWNGALTMVNTYQTRYGVTLQSQTLHTQALIGLDRLDEASDILATIPADEAIAHQLRINLLTAKINAILLNNANGQMQTPTQELSPEQAEQTAQLRMQRTALLQQWLEQDIQNVNAQTLTSVCSDLLRNDQIPTAAKLLDQYLAEHPDNIAVKILKLQTMEENPLQVSPEQLWAIQEKVFESLEDPIQRQVGLSQLYLNQEKFEKARSALDEIPQELAKDDSQVLQAKFKTAIQEENIQEAENLLRPIRALDVDSCEGNLFSAEVEFTKGNYQLALRRLDEALTLQPLSGQIYYLKGRIYEKTEDYEAAIENFQTAQQMQPLNGVYAKSLASVFYARNVKLASKVTPQQQAQAQEAITRAMLLNPTDWRLQSVYAEAISENNPDQALSLRQLILKRYPTIENALMLGNMATRMAKSERDVTKRSGLIQLADDAYQQALQIDPDNETAMQVYADFRNLTGQEGDVTELFKGDENLLWKYYLRNSQFDKALEILKGLFEKNPEDREVIRGLALTAEGMGDRQQAKNYLDRLMELDDTKETELWLLQKYLDNGFTEQVQARLDSFKERYPEESVILLIEAWVEMQNGNLEQSLSLTNRYLETETENASAWRLRGRIYRLMNQPQKSISDLQRSKRIKADPMVRLELASVFKEMGNLQGAVGELKEGLNAPQAPSQLWYMIESSYQEMGDETELDRFYQSVLEKFPKNIFWLYRIGNYYQNQKNYAKAHPYLKEAWDLSLQQENQNLGVLMAYLQNLYEIGNYDEAFSITSKYIDDPVSAAGAYNYMALIQFKQNQADKAKDSFQKALDKAGASDRTQELILKSILQTVGRETVESWCKQKLAQDSTYLPAHMIAYRLDQKEGRYNNAIDHLDQCIQTIGQDNPAWMTLAIKKGNVLLMAYTKTADKDYLNRSIQLFKAMLQKQPEDPSLMNNLAYLLIDNNTEIETALDYARKARQSNPSNAVYLDTYAFALCKVGRYKEAERNLLRALQLNEASGIPIPWDMYNHLGMAYQGQGNTQQAIENYQKALDTSTEIPQEEKQSLQEKIQLLKQEV